MTPEWAAVVMQVVTAIGAVGGAYLAVRVQLVQLSTEVAAINKEMARIDNELIRVRSAVERRRYDGKD